MPHDDLFRPSNVPDWVREILGELAHIRRELRHMKQTTTDVVTAVNALIDNSAKVDAAIDNALNAQSSEDDAALLDALTKLRDLKTDQDKHLAALTTAVPPVVAAPADPAQVTIAAPTT